ncbi:hypothetical protein GCM10009848_07110 [Micromonospora lupini]|uniref:Uncharacterized protein n=1 Tax=Micromonospora lupini str. Lupac 08 TaxID=1150864 RepID=I0LBU4_9ACTN|nr:hypothetical protein MILUP08_46186 [Micromonospora lupini str. Lupac 08]
MDVREALVNVCRPRRHPSMDLMTTVDTLANHQASHKPERRIGVSICPFASEIVMHRDVERCPRNHPFVAERDRSGGVVRLDAGARVRRCRSGPPGRARPRQNGDVFPARISRPRSGGLPFVQVKAVEPVKGVR